MAREHRDVARSPRDRDHDGARRHGPDHRVLPMLSSLLAWHNTQLEDGPSRACTATGFRSRPASHEATPGIGLGASQDGSRE